MKMSARQRVVRDLEGAANRIAEVPRRELQVLLRQAALLLRNLPEPKDEEGYRSGHLMDRERTRMPHKRSGFVRDIPVPNAMLNCLGLAQHGQNLLCCSGKPSDLKACTGED
jgi:hypothetical protein